MTRPLCWWSRARERGVARVVRLGHGWVASVRIEQMADVRMRRKRLGAVWCTTGATRGLARPEPKPPRSESEAAPA